MLSFQVCLQLLIIQAWRAHRTQAQQRLQAREVRETCRNTNKNLNLFTLLYILVRFTSSSFLGQIYSWEYWANKAGKTWPGVSIDSACYLQHGLFPLLGWNSTFRNIIKLIWWLEGNRGLFIEIAAGWVCGSCFCWNAAFLVQYLGTENLRWKKSLNSEWQHCAPCEPNFWVYLPVLP